MRRSFAVMVAGGLFAGCAHTQLPREQLQSPGQLLFNGYANPKADCHGCHKGDASGTWKGPSLDVTSDWSDADILQEIDEGPGIMPSYRDALSAGEKAQIVAWLRERFPPAR